MRRYRRLWYAVLIVPFVGLLWVSIYARETPRVFGFPFFYWYQFVWVPVAAVLTYISYLGTRPRREEDSGAGGGS